MKKDCAVWIGKGERELPEEKKKKQHCNCTQGDASQAGDWGPAEGHGTGGQER